MIKQRLTALSFLQFFIWGCWLITIGAFWFETKQWGPDQFGVIFSTMGISALFMPAIAGILSDRFINAEKLYGILHILGGFCLFFVPASATPDEMFWRILLTMIFYMPTISMSSAPSASNSRTVTRRPIACRRFFANSTVSVGCRCCKAARQ
jgi:NHS family xanthosine MFS transporter